jgi:hypothetical protein
VTTSCHLQEPARAESVTAGYRQETAMSHD